LIPNGPEPESPLARPRFHRFVARPEVTLAYVTGRDLGLVERAIRDYSLPRPSFVIGDVGTSLYAAHRGGFHPVDEWQRKISRDWVGGRAAVEAQFAGVAGLRLQEPEKQGPFKLSFYAPPDFDVEALRKVMGPRLAASGLRSNLVWSVDEAAGTGLLDVLPESATKYHGISFLMKMLRRDASSTVFAGDSGNDLDVLVSPIPSVLVGNAKACFRKTVRQQAAASALGDRLYCATGGWGGMNGNYCAGILEGISHFHPDLLSDRAKRGGRGRTRSPGPGRHGRAPLAEVRP